MYPTSVPNPSLDRDLGPLERFTLQSHIIYCRACRRYLLRIKLVRCALRRLATLLETDRTLPGPSSRDPK